jgi:hypothetical protein
MKNSHYRFVAWFVAVAAVVFAIGVGLRGREISPPGEAGAGTSTSDDKTLANASETYSMVVPKNWYTEESGTEMSIYPDYDPADASSSPPTCKIEISSFVTSHGTNLDTWLTNDLHADPTASIAEISRAPIVVGPHAISGIEWRGVLNGVTTTLVYAEGPNDIFEIAPSTLSEARDADNDDCSLDLQALVANFDITNYEP